MVLPSYILVIAVLVRQASSSSCAFTTTPSLRRADVVFESSSNQNRKIPDAFVSMTMHSDACLTNQQFISSRSVIPRHIDCEDTKTDQRSDGSFTDYSKGRRYLFSQVMSSMMLLCASPQSAHAERTLGTVTESYRRYVPRMEEGFSFLANELKAAIEEERYDNVVSEITAERGTKMSAMKGTMRIFATAFSDSVVSTATREMQLAVFKTNEQLDAMVDAVREGRKDDALVAHRRAVYFAQTYSELANAAIPRGLEPIRGPLGVGKKLTERDMSVTGSF